MVLGQPQRVIAEFVHHLGDRLGLVEDGGELVVRIAPLVGRGGILTMIGDVDVTGIDRHELVDHPLVLSRTAFRNWLTAYGRTAARATALCLSACPHGRRIQGCEAPAPRPLWRGGRKTRVSRSNPRRGTPHDRRVSHLYPAAGLGRDRRGALWPGLAGPRQAVAARRLLAHRGRPAEPDHPCVVPREALGSPPDPRRVAEARRLAAQHPRIRHRAEERDFPAGAVLAETRAGPARRDLRDPHLYAEARQHPRPDRPLEHPDRRAGQTVAAGLCRALRTGRAQPLVPHLGLQGRRRALRDPREGPQGRHLAAAWRAARRDPGPGEHAGGAGRLLAAALTRGDFAIKKGARG